MAARVNGLHHVTSGVWGAQEDIDFFTQVVGQRMIKQTILFDGTVSFYHLYYANADAEIGSVSTTFPFSQDGHKGPARLRPDRLDRLFGAGRLAVVLDGPFQEAQDRDRQRGRALRPEDAALPPSGRPRFRDDRGQGRQDQGLDDQGDQGRHRGARLPLGRHVGARHRGAGAFPDRRPRPDQGRRRRQLPPLQDQRGRRAEDRRARPRARHEAGLLAVRAGHRAPRRLRGADREGADSRSRRISKGLGYTDVSEIKDRNYFHSIYCRSPGGILCEVATCDIGFAIDEPKEHLGEKLLLPPWFEPRRAEIEAQLEKIKVPQGAMAH